MQGDQLRSCYLLLPGYDLDEFPRSGSSAEAENLLSAWVAMWHPKLLSACSGIPIWHQAHSVPGDLEGLLILVPSITAESLSHEYEHIDTDSTSLVQLDATQDCWRSLQTELLQNLGWSPDLLPDGTKHLADDFAALGYAYLQLQLMTRQLRYTSNLDPTLFSEQVCAAANAALAGAIDEAEEKLQVCFDTLGQERDHYYSLDVNIIDVTLLASSTLGKSLQGQLAEASYPSSFLAPAELLEQLQTKSPETLESLKTLVASESASLIGGLHREREHSLLGREMFRRELERGRQSYAQLGLAGPKVYSQLSFGMAPEHASQLRRSGFEGALLIPWTDGQYPEGSQAKLSWESSDGVFLQCLACPPLDGNHSASFLAFGWQIGEALDHQHVPTIVIAHWPNRISEFYRLLQIVARRTTALGRLQTVERYFAETDEPYHQERLSASGFKYDWLKQAGATGYDLILKLRDAYHLQTRLRSLQNLVNLLHQLDQTSAVDPSQESEEPTYHAPPTQQWNQELADLYDGIDGLLDDSSPRSAKELHSQFDTATGNVLAKLAAKLVGKSGSVSEADSATSGLLLLNPRSAPQRFRVQNPDGKFFEDESWVFASGMVGQHRYTALDVPSLGFVQASMQDYEPQSKGREPALAEAGGMLQNEFLEVQIDTQRGHLRSFHVPARRGNRLSVMLAFRQRQVRQAKGGKAQELYSEMVAKDVKMLTSSNLCGLIRATGKLEFDGAPIARFEIDYEVWRGSRVLEAVVRLFDVESFPLDQLWDSAFVLRLAWANDAAQLKTYQHDCFSLASTPKFVAPQLVEIDEVEYRTHYLPNGLAFHRRTDLRFLETVLPVKPGKSAEPVFEHRFGIGVDLPHPRAGSADFMDQRYAIPLQGKLQPSNGWLVTADASNVAVDLQSPLCNASGETVGIRLFVSESLGKSTSTKIRLPHNVASAARVDDLGVKLGQVSASEDAIILSLRSHEQVSIDVLWANPSP